MKSLISTIFIVVLFALFISCKKTTCNIYNEEGGTIGSCAGYTHNQAIKNCEGLTSYGKGTLVCEEE